VVDGRAEGFEPYEEVLAASHSGEIADSERGGPMFYTSGTTGHPKGVRSALAAVGGPPEVLTLIAHSMRPVLDLPPEGGGVQVVCGPIYHSAQWVFGHFALLCGATLVLQHRFDADDLLELIDRHGVTNAHLVPTQMVRMLDLPAERRAAFSGASLRSIIHGAAPCPPDVKRRMIDWVGPVVSEYYGGTEGGFIAMISAEEWLARPAASAVRSPSWRWPCCARTASRCPRANRATSGSATSWAATSSTTRRPRRRRRRTGWPGSAPSATSGTSTRTATSSCRTVAST
jgi:long-chain acyl-CoA synthetase